MFILTRFAAYLCRSACYALAGAADRCDLVAERLSRLAHRLTQRTDAPTLTPHDAHEGFRRTRGSFGTDTAHHRRNAVDAAGDASGEAIAGTLTPHDLPAPAPLRPVVQVAAGQWRPVDLERIHPQASADGENASVARGSKSEKSTSHEKASQLTHPTNGEAMPAGWHRPDGPADELDAPQWPPTWTIAGDARHEERERIERRNSADRAAGRCAVYCGPETTADQRAAGALPAADAYAPTVIGLPILTADDMPPALGAGARLGQLDNGAAARVVAACRRARAAAARGREGAPEPGGCGPADQRGANSYETTEQGGGGQPLEL